MTGRLRIMNWKRCRWKQAYNNFKVLCLSWKFPGRTEENHNQFQSGMPVTRPRFELGTCRIGLQGTGVSARGKLARLAQELNARTNCLRVRASKTRGNFITSLDKITTQQDSYQHFVTYIHNKRMPSFLNRWMSLENKHSHPLLM